MDWPTFVASIVSSIAWPATALAIIWLLRKEILRLLPFLSRLKAGPIEAEFEREVAEIKSDPALQLPPPAPKSLAGRTEQLLQLASISPRSAILEAWQGIEFAIRRAGLQRIGGSPPPDVSSPLRVVRELSQAGLLSNEDVSLFHDLRGLRNQATHAPDFNPTYEAVRNYIDLAARLQVRFEVLANVES